ncbi:MULTISPECIES: FAD binding domain-containing protein [Chelativorans]|jgi:carbon-monoxide dehydrogenase medium subunit|uniref:Molybdopterin dehydrogenase, FAD-binding protein n=1 Tax=Chelativorans sp. (strain BNC1) TaxID=266779 RepID=Q11L48_CHESB|nr:MULTISPECIES: FAD binding domain-containing protein [Chelativorans]
MIPNRFDYAAPKTLDAALELLSGRNDAKILGGGTVLVPLMGLGDVKPSVVVDLRNLPLSGITKSNGSLLIGAAATYKTIAADRAVGEMAPLLAYVSRQITGGPQILSQATAGGSACYSNPASDVPASIVALDARMRLGSAAGTRTLSALEFFTGAFTNVLRPDEVLLEILIPPSCWNRFGYIKQKHATSSWPIVTAACLADNDRNVRIAVGGAASRPYVVEGICRTKGCAEDIGQRASEALVDPWSDALAPAAYRQRIVKSVVTRAVKQALAEATA